MVEVRRLVNPDHHIEVEVDAVLHDPVAERPGGLASDKSG